MKNVEVISKVVNRDKAGQTVTSAGPPVDLSNYVSITGKQEIAGEKNFVGGLKVNGGKIVYDEINKYWKLEGDLLVTGAVSMLSNAPVLAPSNIMDHEERIKILEDEIAKLKAELNREI